MFKKQFSALDNVQMTCQTIY